MITCCLNFDDVFELSKLIEDVSKLPGAYSNTIFPDSPRGRDDS